jgi:hypothetical protein
MFDPSINVHECPRRTLGPIQYFRRRKYLNHSRDKNYQSLRPLNLLMVVAMSLSKNAGLGDVG